ncbi:zinc finger, CCHC-type containing protein [Tanacetum coccineum]
MGLEVRSVHPEVTEHPDSDSGKREFKPMMNFSELTLQWWCNPTVEQVRKRAKWDNDDYVCRGLILNFICVLRSLSGRKNNVASPLVVNMVEHNNSSRYNDKSGKRKHHDTKADPNKKPKVTCWKCGKPGHLKKDCKASNVGNKANGSGTKGLVDGSSNSLKDDDVAWWVDSGATVHVCKDRCWFKTYESLNDGSILHMGNESTALVHRCGCVNLRLNIVSDNIGSAFMSTSKLNDSIIWHARLGHVHFKRMQDMSKDGLIPAFDMDTEKYFVTFIDDASRFCYVYLLHSKDEALDKFKVFKIEVELQQRSLIKRFGSDRGGEYMDTLYFQSVGIIHETTTLYTPQQNSISKRKNKILKEMVNSMLSYLRLSQRFWGEAMLTVCYLLNRVPNKRNMITHYKPWTKKKPNLNYLRVWGCRAVLRLPGPKLKTLGERGIECDFIGYVEHSKAFRFYVIEPNESVAITSIIESVDIIFDEHRFSLVPRPSQRSLLKGTEDSGGSAVPKKVTEEVVQQPERLMNRDPNAYRYKWSIGSNNFQEHLEHFIFKQKSCFPETDKQKRK